jgi:hypothetical protein
MPRKHLSLIIIGLLSLLLLGGWFIGFYDPGEVIVAFSERVRSIGITASILMILFLFFLKAFTLFPPFVVIGLGCAFIPLWLGIPTAILGHFMGQVVSSYIGASSHFAPKKVRNVPVWTMVPFYFCGLSSDLAFIALRKMGATRVKALLCSIPFIIVTETLIVTMGMGLIGLIMSIG